MSLVQPPLKRSPPQLLSSKQREGDLHYFSLPLEGAILVCRYSCHPPGTGFPRLATVENCSLADSEGGQEGAGQAGGGHQQEQEEGGGLLHGGASRQ